VLYGLCLEGKKKNSYIYSNILTWEAWLDRPCLSVGGSPATLLQSMLLLSGGFLGSRRGHWARRAIRCVLAVAVGTPHGASIQYNLWTVLHMYGAGHLDVLARQGSEHDSEHPTPTSTPHPTFNNIIFRDRPAIERWLWSSSSV
jgi:hypothetical protein